MEDFLEDFTTDLFTKAGFEPKEFAELREELEPVIWDYILNKLVEKMTPKQQNEADALLDQDDGEWFHELCLKVIPDYDDYFATILKEFEELYLKEIESDDEE